MRNGALRHNGGMVKSVEGVYRNGKVELTEPIAEAEGSRVIVTWVHPATSVDLRERGIDEYGGRLAPPLGPVYRGLGSPRDGCLR